MKKIWTNYPKKASCFTCDRILISICEKMSPLEAEVFRIWVAEIQENDGHVISERFLRLYRCGLFGNESPDHRMESEAAKGI